MSIILVWVLVYSTHVHSGSVTNVVGDFATVQDCEAVQKAMIEQYEGPRASNTKCVQVKKYIRAVNSVG